MSIPGWTDEHDVILQELIHHSWPGGTNLTSPPLSWSEIGKTFHWLAPRRGLGEQSFPLRKLKARYYQHIEPQYRNNNAPPTAAVKSSDGDPAKDTSRNGQRQGGRIIYLSDGESGTYSEILERGVVAMEGTKRAIEEGVGKKGFFDTMDEMDGMEGVGSEATPEISENSGC